MNIMFDLDSTLVNNSVVIDAITEMLQYPDAYDLIHNLNDTGDLIPRQIKEVIHERMTDGLLMTSLKPNTYAQMVVRDIAAQGHNIYVITARGTHDGEVKATTPEYVQDLFPQVKGIALTGHDKLKAIEQLDIDIVIDDNTLVIDSILDSLSVNPLCILLSNENTPWNWNYVANTNNDIVVVRSLIDVPFLIEEFGMSNI